MRLNPRRILLVSLGLAAAAGAALVLSLPDNTTASAAAARIPAAPHALLRPCSEPGQFLPRRSELHRLVAGVQPIAPVLEVVVHPSFHATQVLQLYPRDGQWWIGVSVVAIPRAHLHHRKADSPPLALEEPHPRVEFHERAIAEDTAARMVLEWRRSVETTHAHDAGGLDGVSYGFYFDGRCAQMWSPEPGSRNHRLEAVVDAFLDRAPEADIVRHLQAVGVPRRQSH
jgi:hypothetical protein